ncbi:transporter substrate-binding domain-containing protein [Rhizobium sp. SL42]|uniref:transporter substrate-binding domain-containing protein n=1 Tax=Rhizobium sp. SL42 TaxID=2806346 RepID=UPI003FA69164
MIRIRAEVTSLDLRGLCSWMCRFLLPLLLILAPPAHAQAPAVPVQGEIAGDLPVLFDARERLARPDTNDILRLRFLTTTDFPPFNFTDQTGRLAGFHIDLARALCAELGLEAKCQIQALPYAQLQEALEAGQGDAVLAGVAVTAALRQRFVFSRPYMLLPARFIRHRDTQLSRQDSAALFGRPVGVLAGTAHEAMLKAFFPDIKPVTFETRETMLSALKDRKVDAAFADALQLSFWTQSPAAGNCCTLFDGPYLSERFLGEGMTIMLGPQGGTLAAAIDSALAALSRSGRLEEIYLRYFPSGLY